MPYSLAVTDCKETTFKNGALPKRSQRRVARKQGSRFDVTIQCGLPGHVIGSLFHDVVRRETEKRRKKGGLSPVRAGA